MANAAMEFNNYFEALIDCSKYDLLQGNDLQYIEGTNQESAIAVLENALCWAKSEGQDGGFDPQKWFNYGKQGARRGGRGFIHEINYSKDGHTDMENFLSGSDDRDEAIAEFLNTRLVDEAW